MSEFKTIIYHLAIMWGVIVKISKLLMNFGDLATLHSPKYFHILRSQGETIGVVEEIMEKQPILLFLNSFD